MIKDRAPIGRCPMCKALIIKEDLFDSKSDETPEENISGKLEASTNLPITKNTPSSISSIKKAGINEIAKAQDEMYENIKAIKSDDTPENKSESEGLDNKSFSSTPSSKKVMGKGHTDLFLQYDKHTPSSISSIKKEFEERFIRWSNEANEKPTSYICVIESDKIFDFFLPYLKGDEMMKGER